MTSLQFQIFSSFRTEFQDYCRKLNEQYGDMLRPLQIQAAQKDTSEYPLETPIVYNTDLDQISKDSEIKLIVIGDNPGKDEQRKANQKYLVGQSGKIATSFFLKTPEFQIDFRKNVIILNKTPIHTAKTKHLNSVAKNGGKEIQKLITDSQIFMAQKTAKLHIDLCASADHTQKPIGLWLVGYSELKNNAIFAQYRNYLMQYYKNAKSDWENVFVFQHFSMNRFSIDLKKFMENNGITSVLEAARLLGHSHKNEIFF